MKPNHRRDSTRALLIATGAYFGLVFGAGFVLGVFRVLVLLPRVGERAAELIEAPVMLGATILSARFVVRRFDVPRKPSSTLAVGFGALLLLLVFELTVVLQLRGLSIEAHLASRDPIAGGVYVALLGFYSIAPTLLGYVEKARCENESA